MIVTVLSSSASSSPLVKSFHQMMKRSQAKGMEWNGTIKKADTTAPSNSNEMNHIHTHTKTTTNRKKWSVIKRLGRDENRVTKHVFYSHTVVLQWKSTISGPTFYDTLSLLPAKSNAKKNDRLKQYKRGINPPGKIVKSSIDMLSTHEY